VVTRALAEIGRVETPMIDQVISWAQRAMNKVYLIGGKLSGTDIKNLPIPQNHGIFSLDDLITWYGAESRGHVEPGIRS
jgi:opine dehydrogenase